MKRLLSIELQKLFKNRSSKVLILAYFVLLSLIALIASLKFNIGSFEINIAEQGIFNFPYIWHFNTYIASILKLFLAIVIVSMMANEYSYGTLKQNLIDGMSKKEFILSKFYTIILFALISTVFIFILSLILGYSFSSYDEISIVTTEMEYLFAYFVKLVGFFSFCLFLGILIKRSAFALGFLMIQFIGERITFGILKKHFLSDKMANDLYDLFPLESMSNLIKEPFTRLSAISNLETAIGGEKVWRFYGVHFSEISIVIVWTFIFILTSFYILKKRDL
ncbi:ABC transporter permease [Flavobacterium sp.]|uniref:ABC transporter permease n=1 Tax=Flavobacterium sp. TaxID=239 RepID=UPI003D2CB98B